MNVFVFHRLSKLSLRFLVHFSQIEENMKRIATVVETGLALSWYET